MFQNLGRNRMSDIGIEPQFLIWRQRRCFFLDATKLVIEPS